MGMALKGMATPCAQAEEEEEKLEVSQVSVQSLCACIAPRQQSPALSRLPRLCRRGVQVMRQPSHVQVSVNSS